MITKTKFLAYVAIPVVGLGLAGVSIASAHGFGMGMGGGTALSADQIASFQQERFQQQATLLGATVDEVKNAWAQGKTMVQLAEEKGITADQLREKMQTARLEQMKAHLKALVDAGVITQAQADQRLQFMQTNTGPQKGGKGMGRGMGRGGFGF